MTTLADLEFLPFDTYEHDGGMVELALDDDVALFIEPRPETSQEGSMHTTIIVSGVRSRSPAGRV